VGNVDATVVAEAPRLATFQETMAVSVAECLGVEVGCVNVKVTSSDGLGAAGRGEGIAAMAVVLLESRDG
jgi:2-C-methyl-D-erythritol 2,4-cyclodiphosphate synthase